MGIEFLFMDYNSRPHRTNIVGRRMPSIVVYHPYRLSSILTGLESNRACWYRQFETTGCLCKGKVQDDQGCSAYLDAVQLWLFPQLKKVNQITIFGKANPQVHVETPLHPEKLTVWCALWAGGVIGPYFFKNNESHNVTLNGDPYRAMITNFFIPELNNHEVQELWFQQDGATCHIARATIDLLKDTFGDHLISRFGPVN
ncbi:DUF4817 domain-containing protein [Trichonephila clavipes]|nr:DUF4817 domain-containing protein [Trichonephila clavipes]